MTSTSNVCHLLVAMPRVLQCQLIENLPLSNFSYRRVGSTRNIFSVINGVLSATVRFLISICSVSMAALLFYGKNKALAET